MLTETASPDPGDVMEIDPSFDMVDPTKKVALVQKIERCSIGKTPSRFFKVRADLSPPDLIKLIGYDPRAVAPKAKTPANISNVLEELIMEVQRTIDQERVGEMVEYLRQAVQNESYADWSEIDIVTVAKPDTANYNSEHYVAFPQAAEYFITDGQHRYCAILDFAKQYPDLQDRFTVAVAIGVLPQEHLREWAGQSFHDKNYLQKQVKATKALAVDLRDLHNRLAKELHEHKVIKQAGGINVLKDSVAAGAVEFTTHSLLYKFVRGFTEGSRGVFKGVIKNPNLTEETYAVEKAKLGEYLNLLGEAFPSWTMPPEDREPYLFRASAALQGLGSLGNLLYNKIDNRDLRRKMVMNIGEKAIDWKRTNVELWGPVIGRVVDGAVSPSSTRQIIESTAKFLRERSGIKEGV
jgi:DGQHR domain-containing protein